MAVTDRRGVELAGEPDRLRVSYASGAGQEEVERGDGGFDIPFPRVPDLLTIEWDIDGTSVTAEVEAVTARYCAVEDVLTHLSEQSLDTDMEDSAVQGAIDRAESLIERECKRYFQPVAVRGVVDRPNCTTSSMVFVGDGTASDIRGVLCATDQDGRRVTLRRASDVLLDVRDLGRGKFAECVLVCGMRSTPPDVKPAVVSLASWYLTPHAHPDNATSTSTDLGFMRFVVGGVDGAATSIPEVNALIDRYGLADLKVR